MAFDQPPHTQNFRGDRRHIGFEFEFAELSLDDGAALVRNLFGGLIEAPGKFKRRIRGTRFGDFRVEADSTVMKERSYRDYLHKVGLDPDTSAWVSDVEDAVGRAALKLVPCEIVTPPIPLDQLDAMEALRVGLERVEARGTRASLFYAFGLHINPDIASAESLDLCRYLQAYAVLEPSLRAEIDIDVSRRLTSYIDPYPASYAAHILAAGYAPDMAGLVADYLRFNPTRNRGLDMMPLFAYLAPDAMKAMMEAEPLIKPRPAFHYRLPNCSLLTPTWNVAVEWNRWVRVERLAENPDALAEACRSFWT